MEYICHVLRCKQRNRVWKPNRRSQTTYLPNTEAIWGTLGGEREPSFTRREFISMKSRGIDRQPARPSPVLNSGPVWHVWKNTVQFRRHSVYTKLHGTVMWLSAVPLAHSTCKLFNTDLVQFRRDDRHRQTSQWALGNLNVFGYTLGKRELCLHRVGIKVEANEHFPVKTLVIVIRVCTRQMQKWLASSSVLIISYSFNKLAVFTLLTVVLNKSVADWLNHCLLFISHQVQLLPGSRLFSTLPCNAG